MADKQPHKESGPTIRDLYPHFNEEQLKEAKENLERYLELVLRIYERIQADPNAYSQLQSLTGSKREATMEPKRSNTP